MKLRHYSAEPISELRFVEQATVPENKPKGLWVSDDSKYDNWMCYLKNLESTTYKDYFEHRTQYRTNVKIKSLANICIINSIEKLNMFASTYDGMKHEQYTYFLDFIKDKPGIDKGMENLMRKQLRGIMWHEVAKKYSGILITPYLHQATYSHFWYENWDCASGCIWDKDAIILGRCVRIKNG